MEKSMIDVVRFYFGDIDGAERSVHEEACLKDRDLLREYFAFKKDVEETRDGLMDPTPALAARVRKAVRQELMGIRRMEPGPWLRWGTLAAAAGLALLMWWTQGGDTVGERGTSGPASPAEEVLIDDSGLPRHTMTL